MILALLASLLLSAVDAQAVTAAQLEAVIDTQDNAAELRAIWEIECTSAFPCGKISKAGACGPFQAMPTNKANPPCELLDREPWVAVMTAQAELRQHRIVCGTWPKARTAYSKGYKRKPERGCFEPGSYDARVRQLMRRK